jgi:predicted Rossmann fold nucleotide-binding protein DprA/Smf involved in DNA uptake
LISDDETRELRAGLSMCFGTGLPAPLVDAAQAQGLYPNTWAYPRILGDSEHGMTAAKIRRFGQLMLADADNTGITLLLPGDPGWPAGCSELSCLWVRGNNDVAGLLQNAVTVTGTKNPTDDGILLAAGLVTDLARAGQTIVTSTSRGIDTHVVRAALAVPGATPVLLARAGLMVPLGPAMEAALPEVLGRGAILSPVPPNWKAANENLAQARFELLYRLANATVLVEARADSRHLSAARNAAKSGHLVCAVPAAAGWRYSAGCHELIHEGAARLITTSGQVLALAKNRGRHDSTLFFVRGRALIGVDQVLRDIPAFQVYAASPAHAANQALDIIAGAGARPARLELTVELPLGEAEEIVISLDQ